MNRGLSYQRSSRLGSVRSRYTRGSTSVAVSCCVYHAQACIQPSCRGSEHVARSPQHTWLEPHARGTMYHKDYPCKIAQNHADSSRRYLLAWELERNLSVGQCIPSSCPHLLD